MSNDCCPSNVPTTIKNKKLIITGTLQGAGRWKANGKCHAWIGYRKHQNKMNASTTLIQMKRRTHCFYLVIGWTYMDSVTEKLECWKMFYTFRDHKPLLSNKELTKNTYCLKLFSEQLRILGITWHHSFWFCFFFFSLWVLTNQIGCFFITLPAQSQEQTCVEFCF